MVTQKDSPDQLPILTDVCISAFKSVVDQRLHLEPLTILVGKNGSGKSNVIEALATLARMMSGERVVDALVEGTDISEPIRGQAEGCVPFGRDRFELGCTVQRGRTSYRYVVGVRATSQDVVVIKEELVAYGLQYGGKLYEERVLLKTTGHSGVGSFDVSVFNGARGRDPGYSLRSDRLAITQLSNRLPESKATDAVLRGAESVRSALRGISVVDPVPQQMREYVREGDRTLRRSGENLSAALDALRTSDNEAFAELGRLLSDASEKGVQDITFARTDFGDVMFGVLEAQGQRVPARLMSDGLLRLAAIATAVVTSGGNDGHHVLVVEELENGLHPWLAREVLAFLKRASVERNTKLVVSTHSTALLDALEADEHRGVVLISRDRTTGLTTLVPLPTAPGYVDATLRGGLGHMLVTGSVGAVAQSSTPPDLAPIFGRLLGVQQ